jgi:HEAT repeat protein
MNNYATILDSSVAALLADPGPDLRVLSIYALEQLKAKEALPRLKALIQDGEMIHFDGLGTVGKAAMAAIAKLNSCDEYEP